MNTKIAPFILMLFTATIASCYNDNDVNSTINPKPTFTISRNSETMPVWVHGKEDSEYLILVVHGGPGSDVLDFRTYKGGSGFRQLENSYLVVYWQQRASGQSVGSDNSSLFTIDNYVSDADMVVEELKNRYPNKKIVLFGHSWGGTLTAAYLRADTRRAKIEAWVDAAGVHNGSTLHQTTIDDINAQANARIRAGENVSYWESIKRQLEDSPQESNAIAYSVTNEIPEVAVKVNNSDFSFSERAARSNNALFPEILKTNLTSSLADYTLPVLMLWGKYDFAVSNTLKQEVLNNIGSENVTNILFSASGHYMMFHEPNLFARSMKDFIEGL